MDFILMEPILVELNNGENMKNGGGRRNMEGGERPQDKQNNSQSEGNI